MLDPLRVVSDMNYSKKLKRSVLDTPLQEDNISQVNAFKIAHQSLMTEYYDLLNQVSKLPFFVNSADVMYGKFIKSDRIRFKILIMKIVEYIPRQTIRLATLRFLIRLFVESHIKGKLKQLEASYIQYAQTISKEGEKYLGITNWLKEAGEF